MAEMTVPLVARGNGLWGSSSPAWDHLIMRESSGRPTVIQQIQDVNSGGNEAEGLFQITPATWRLNRGTDFAASARLATPQQQAIIAARIFTRNPTGSDWGAGRPGRESAADLAAGLVPLKSTPGGTTAVPTITVPRPDFNEINQIDMDLVNGSYQHASTRSRMPINFFLHTEQPAGTGLGPAYDAAATDLAAYLRSTGGTSAVSYHYCVRQATDGGVTVVDVVDTDYYCWAVLNANVFSVNLCFAGSKVEWTRDQWMTQSKAIDVAAYLAVQDAYKYGFSIEVIPPPYSGAARAGISDHRYVTRVLGYGTHTDVGDNFPWDYFTQRVNYYTSNAPVVTQPANPTPVPAAVWPKSATDRELLEWLVNQMGDGDPAWPSKGMTLRDKVWSLGKAQA